MMVSLKNNSKASYSHNLSLHLMQCKRNSILIEANDHDDIDDEMPFFSILFLKWELNNFRMKKKAKNEHFGNENKPIFENIYFFVQIFQMKIVHNLIIFIYFFLFFFFK